jgi:hypothetical protein
MTIKGLTDRGLSFPEIGKIRKGGKKTDPRKPGPDLKYFRVEFDEAETMAIQKFTAVYKDQPTAIRIILPFNEIEKMWDAWLEAYTAGRMVARSDGEKYLYRIDTETGEIVTKNGVNIKTGQPDPYIEGAPVGYYTSRSTGKKEAIYCKATGRLKVIIPELERAAYVTVLTTSIHDIANISDQLRAFQTINNGRISGIPLILRRRPKEISTPSQDGGRARRVKWLLSIEADPEWVQRALGHLNTLALPGSSEYKPAELPAGEPLDTEPDADEIEEGDYTETGAEGQGPTEDNPPVMTLETAMTITSPRGAMLTTLTDEQLATLAEQSDSEIRRAAAGVILAHRTKQYLDEIDEAEDGEEIN